VIYEELEPLPDQRQIVACYWRFEVQSHDTLPCEHVIVPDGTVSISYFEDAGTSEWGVAINGPGVEARKVHLTCARRRVAVRLCAGVVRPVLGFEAGSLRGRSLPLLKSQCAARNLRAALAGYTNLADARRRLQPTIEQWLAAAQPLDTVTIAAARAIADAGGRVVIGELAASLNLSQRQLRRRFAREVGLSPKEFARARRVRRAFVEALREMKSRWSQLSTEVGFADQAHLTREFREVFGVPPQVVDAYIRSIRHERIVDA
jgi:AraC-like DNA-binding protein